MESLNSFKDVYSDFKTDLENKMTSEKGESRMALYMESIMICR